MKLIADGGPIDNHAVDIVDQHSIGEGGEAWAYWFEDGIKYAAKIYKGPDCADYQGDDPQDKLNRDGAAHRLEVFPQNLAMFPKGLPENVGQPLGLLRSKKKGKARGFYMGLVPEPRETVRALCDVDFRQGGYDTNTGLDMLVNLYKLMKACHTNSKGKLILGDFNDLNVLGPAPWVIDAESGSYGTKQCTTFTQRFADPLKCAKTKPDGSPATSLMLAKPHDENSDIYAWVCMVFQTLFLISQYEGVWKPKDKSKKCAQDARPLHRATVMVDGAKWPKWVINLGLTPDVMPDDLMEQFDRYFHKDFRGEFPLDVLQRMRWTTCTNCGNGHGRATCPKCATPGIVRSVTEVKGTVTAERIYKTKGVIILAAYHRGDMKWLVYENDHLKRETDQVILKGKLDPRLRYRLMGDSTCLAKGGQLITFQANGAKDQKPIDKLGEVPMFDTNSNKRFWLHTGRLLADKKVAGLDMGERVVGQVLRNQTIFWAGEEFGFGFYRASQLSEFFVFDTDDGILKDGLTVPPIKGQLVDATCSFSSNRCWFFSSFEIGGKTTNRCTILDKTGNVLGTIEEDAGSDTWLGSGLRGVCAVGIFLFKATDDGLVRVQYNSGLFETASFPDTEPFVDAGCQLFPGNQCLHVVTRNEIHKIRMN